MNKLTVSLSGIVRNTDDSISIDGQALELINARLKNGSIEPIGQPILERSFYDGISPAYIHKNGSYEHVITYGDDGNIIFDSKRINGSYNAQNIIICKLLGLTEVQSIGNTLMFITNEGIHYSLFADGNYQFLGQKPDFPEISLMYFMDNKVKSSEEVWCDLDPRIKMRSGEWVTLNTTSKTLVNNSFRGTINKFMKELNDEGEYVYPFVARYALKLFDGSYIMHSAPILLYPKGYAPSIFVTGQTNDDGFVTDFNYKVSVQSSTLNLKYDTSPLEKWKDIISSVDIFISKQINTDNLDEDVISFFCTGDKISFKLNKLTNSEIIEKIENTTNFYKVKSIPIGAGALSLYEGLVKSVDNLEQKDPLTDDAFTHNTITGKTYVFNSRLHVGNIKMKFAPMYPISIFQTDALFSLIIVNTEIHIKTDSGIKIIHGSGTWNRSPLSPYFSYPDSRAFKLVIYFNNGGNSYYREFNLKAHPLLNTAYCIETLTPYSINNFNAGVYTPLEKDDSEVSPNKLKVSEVSNPFYFPAKLTYSVSNRGITGMAAATAALSTGQFGQFPLYVFTEEGIFALSTGTNIAYTNSYPVSRDCCNNPLSLISTDNAVVFSTSRGLMILSGSTVEKISDSIEGFLSTSIDSSPIIKKIASIAEYEQLLSSTEFVYFLENARIGYNYEDKEIVVANPTFGYSYVFNMESGQWHKISASIKSFINSYPECFATLSDKGMYNLHNNHRTVNKILLLTRPIKFGSVTHKRILQSAIRGIVKPSQSDLYFRGEPVIYRDQGISIFSNCGFYVLGSNDAEHFILISGKEKIEDIRDLITKMNKTRAFKYFMFCIVGGVRTDVALSHVEVIIDETFTNRLR